ncbi:MAG: anaerobic ribonucleoside-triphosphate reductase activating protein [Clostridia bacterium]
MKIHGLNKLTLLDYPTKTACTVFTGGCNFRCPFCQNASLVLDPESQPTTPEEEFFDFLKSRKNILEGVCITGGEPTLSSDLPEFIAKIKAEGMAVKLDTNGNNFEMLKKLVDEKLVDYVAMDVKNSLPRYAKTIGLETFDTTNIEKSVEFLKTCGIDYEFRTTIAVELQNENAMEKIGQLVDGASKFFLQRYRDGGDMVGAIMTPPSLETLQKFKAIMEKYVRLVEIRGI